MEEKSNKQVVHVTLVNQQHNINTSSIQTLQIDNEENKTEIGGVAGAIAASSSIVDKWMYWNNKEKLYKLFIQRRFKDCISLLNNMPPKITGSNDETEMLLLEFQIYCKCKRGSEAQRTLSKLSSSFCSTDFDPKTLMTLASSSFNSGDFLKSFLLYVISAKLCIRSEVGDKEERFRTIFQCIQELKKVSKAVKSEHATICKDVVIPTMSDIISESKAIKEDGDNFHINHAWMLHYLGLCYDELKMYKEAVNAHKSSCRVLEEGLGDVRAAEYKLYAFCWHNAAAALGKWEQYRLSKEAYEKAHEMNLMAKDWANEREKEKCVALTESNYSRICNKIIMLRL